MSYTPGPILLSTEELASLLECSVKTVQSQAREGKLPGLKFGDAWVFPVAALTDSLNEQAKAESDKRKATPKAETILIKKEKRTVPAWMLPPKS